MAEQQTEKEQKARESCIYRVFSPLCIRSTGQYIMGTRDNPVIADLSDCEDASIKHLLTTGQIESADGEPINKPVGAVKRKPCPCSKKGSS
jgi:hypothetical protein